MLLLSVERGIDCGRAVGLYRSSQTVKLSLEDEEVDIMNRFLAREGVEGFRCGFWKAMNMVMMKKCGCG